MFKVKNRVGCGSAGQLHTDRVCDYNVSGYHSSERGMSTKRCLGVTILKLMFLSGCADHFCGTVLGFNCVLTCKYSLYYAS